MIGTWQMPKGTVIHLMRQVLSQMLLLGSKEITLGQMKMGFTEQDSGKPNRCCFYNPSRKELSWGRLLMGRI